MELYGEQRGTMILRKIKLDEKQKHSGITAGDWMRDIQKHHLLVMQTIAKGDRVTMPITEHRLVIDQGKRSG